MWIILAAALLISPEQADSSPTSSQDEIVILGERMRRIRLGTKTDRRTGLTRCVVKRPSGDPSFDTMMCNALLACAKTVRTESQMEACMRPSMNAYVQQRIARRASSKPSDNADR